MAPTLALSQGSQYPGIPAVRAASPERTVGAVTRLYCLFTSEGPIKLFRLTPDGMDARELTADERDVVLSEIDGPALNALKDSADVLHETPNAGGDE